MYQNNYYYNKYHFGQCRHGTSLSTHYHHHTLPRHYWNGTIVAVEEIVNNLDWRTYAYSTKNTKWEEIAYWVGKARNFKNEYDRPNNSDERKMMLKQQFAQFHYDFLQTASEEFDAFSTRWLDNMPELDTEFVVSK